MPIPTSSSNGAPVEAKDEAVAELAADTAVATVGLSPLPGAVETREAGVLPEDDGEVADVPAGVAVEGAVTGWGHEESALPSRAACRPQNVNGAVAAVPGVPVDVDVGVEPAQAEMGAKTGMDPVGVVGET